MNKNYAMTINQWLESIPKRGDESLVCVPPSALVQLLADNHLLVAERDILQQRYDDLARRFTETREQLKAANLGLQRKQEQLRKAMEVEQ